MNLYNVLYDNKNKIGKILFAISILLFFYMLIIPMNHYVIHIDEHFTLGLIQLSTDDFWKLIVSDVHPPLYYLILRYSCSLLSGLNISYNVAHVCTLISVIPYAIILILSYTKIRKEYTWFTAGLLVFSLATMSELFQEFLIIRMYSFGLLFILIAFIYFKDILEKSDTKSWAIFTLNIVLSIYTHYFLLIISGLMYLLYLLYIYLKNNIDKKDELMKWLISAISVIICYVPWIFTLYNQVMTSHDAKQEIITTSADLINYYSFFAIKSPDFHLEVVIMKIIAFIVLALVIINYIKQARRIKLTDNYYIFSGLVVYFLTLLIGTAVLTLTFKPLVLRYIIPLIGILYFTIAVSMGKMDNKKIFSIILILLLLLSVFCVYTNSQNYDRLYHEGHDEKVVLDNINNENNVMIYNSSFHYNCYHYLLNNSNEYSLKNLTTPYKTDCNVTNNLTKILEDNPDKDIYIVRKVSNKTEEKMEGYDAKKVGNRGTIWFMKINNPTTNESDV